MKFRTYKKAAAYAKSLTNIFDIPHVAIRTFYINIFTWERVNCWTVKIK